ncbi:MAG TPA: hypothetical protein IAB51_05820 [Candidatus Merdivicinus excrementipullorum]|uniref:Uncharacterized protein n=1 Tax=Candidatus Merdivicinus excrementipullorum TaxID=2840867 RepID=A0A9D1FNA7_9FIRM|nr:hypothetical protein [Candidatus Merdivicinus excrementipullorum]
MADFDDLLNIAADFLDDADVDKLVKQGSKFFKKLGLDLNAASAQRQQPASPESAAQMQMRQQELKERLKQKHGELLADSPRLTPEPMVPEKMEPERMEPEMLRPDSPAPEGVSTDRAKNRPLRPSDSQLSGSLRVLTEIAGSGLGGAILADEILEPPLAVRSGYFARCRRKLR